MAASADAAAAAAARTLRWAGRAGHLGGVPRAAVIGAIGTVAKAYMALLNTTTVHNADALHRVVKSRPPGTPLLTVSNHMSTIDDPFMWGFKGFPITDAKLARWVLTAEDICFRNAFMSYMFRVGKCVPITRGAGIYQEHMNEALEVLSTGSWLHSFPEGKVAQDHQPIRRLKWGTASLIIRAPVTPIVLPIIHTGFEKVMPEKSFFGRRPPLPLCGKEIQIIVGEPVEFDLPSLKQEAATIPQDTSFERKGWPTITPEGLDEAAQRWLYQKMSDKIQSVMEGLRKTLLNQKQH
ncbi:N-acylphosphatidylethanolamine synthase-like [Lolium perenne]|uniref:N-acylphosphatidylethanolamine synthase-like n=1 Tax=Lolium perenne TaxID=4522 RepID=UPI0021EA4493|nr:N-acylphosphatidylethanolamine synthase-like [Lolium perenne]XP_051219501.1 N-acylphosphatidylethanolamine synthase-like [Lolium perenne]XP_051219502.1 N-acylphosphatidylethanolamine synthase-like [Lolium perenne]XP_051219503.1 N-acylphosphatidylethanolamine synthase-like [Lolium perenne]